MRWMLWPAALTTALLAAADAKDDAVKKDMDALQGKWQLVSMQRDGDAVDVSKDATRVITGDKYELTLRPGLAIKGTYKIDPSARPKKMETTASNGPYKDQELLGIYELSGDTLKICYAPPGKERPTEFKTKEDSGWILTVHKKTKE
jgi:uncharacterized protein (TIGR03067 family)